MSQKTKNYYDTQVKLLLVSLLKYRPEKIILFGSAATGNFHEGSDLDALVIKDTTESFWERQKKVTLMTNCHVPTDLFVLTPLEYERALMENRFFLKNEILSKGKVIYDKNNSALPA